MYAVEVIVQKVEEVTGLKAGVKGGNAMKPLEYFYSRTGVFTYKLELYIHDKDLLHLQDLTSEVMKAINDFADYPVTGVKSIDIAGGGTFSNPPVITQALYYTVVDDSNGDIEPPKPTPHGTTTISDNGVYDISRFETAIVNVEGSGDPYTGPYEYEAKWVEQQAPTEDKYLDRDIQIHKIKATNRPNIHGVGLEIGSL